jgi:transcriptional regulator with XRE-family HTH domain
MENFKDRLEHILRSKNLTASKFAELMEIQPSNVSHLLNGRNKPSVDFLIKLKEIFPEYSFDWIIMGKKPITINDPTPAVSETQDMRFDDTNEKSVIEFDDIDEKHPEMEPIVTDNQDVDKILIVYKDKTYEVLKKRL